MRVHGANSDRNSTQTFRRQTSKVNPVVVSWKQRGRLNMAVTAAIKRKQSRVLDKYSSVFQIQTVETDLVCFQSGGIQLQHSLCGVGISGNTLSVTLVAAGISHDQSYHHRLCFSARAVHSAFPDENSLQHSCHKSFSQGDSMSLCRRCRIDTSKYTLP